MTNALYNNMEDEIMYAPYESEATLWTFARMIKVSRSALAALGDPDYLLMTYDNTTKYFYLCAVEDKETANIRLGRRYYETLGQMSLTENKDYGPHIKMNPSFMEELKGLGWEMGKTYKVPCVKMPFDFYGTEVPAIYYSLRDAYHEED